MAETQVIGLDQNPKVHLREEVNQYLVSGSMVVVTVIGHMKHYRAFKSESQGANSFGFIEDTKILSVDSPLVSCIFLYWRASFHSSPHHEIMEKHMKGNFGKVYLADDEPLDIVGRGNVHIKLPTSSIWTLHDVRHFRFEEDILFMGQLDSKGCVMTFSNNC